MDVEFKDLRYSVKTGRRERKDILNGITGFSRAGELLAVMGPSGSGKTSLLNILAGRMYSKDVQGYTSYGGEEYSKKTRRQMGFVTQEDLMFGNLTVMESLMCTANLRLPSSLSKAEKIERVEQVMGDLKLRNVGNTLIGDGLFKKGVSGGERKRVAIAAEILVDPQILFLDEPTSGLDSSIAFSIVKYLKQLTSSGKTVILSIHQPSSQIYALFDRLMLLRDGRTVYFGPGANVLTFFASAGYACPFGYNPADFFMSLISKGKEANGTEPAESAEMVLAALEYQRKAATPVSTALAGEQYEVENSMLVTKDRSRKYPVSWFTQFSTLLGRSIKQRRGTIIESLAMIKYLTVTFLFCVLWFRMEPVEETIRDRIGLLYFSAVFWALQSVLQTVHTFSREASIIRKERQSASYMLSAYFLSKSLVDIPYDLIYPTIFVVTVYWITGLDPYFYKFVIYVVIIFSQVICAFSIGLAASSATLNVRKAIVLASVYTMSSVLLSGFYANTSNFGPLANVVQYFSFLRFSYSALVLNETNGATYACSDTSDTATELEAASVCPITQEQVLQEYPVVPIGIAGNVAIVWAFTFLYRLLAFMFLRMRKVV
uniref:Probable ATP-dependent transporter ycf16 n=1 Tax=Rhodosorus marinus TaxID=101924 RepID=A0A7S3A343_9RHOD|mmetsp:Transcript_42148/g.164801  ORF Transcript_42148/g.164801 Transcript_42148/m.164801 type:complete len:602 (+) Transcript_42148:345-2150(+)|eukprot:CAMPEP_0113969934 /NCGR_PEP_ID=MMETSP0011_2-20120614/10716_1 /TAXON_ID=101924 /ORGANISM="Rhodosorus marinus" /LENGTH=601 /DNA_ID=CAMNT_0000983893 /DNA_START=345 /DNA_END=2150 /DNA_ORIENTATION=- /assembly_acc=CAM_ASM_000156